MKPSFARRLTASYLFVVVATLLFTFAFLTRRLEKTFLHQLEESLAAQSLLIAQSLPAATGQALQAHIENLGQTMSYRITLIARDGTVLADSNQTAEQVRQMDNHGNRPEVQAALAAGHGESIRHSATLHANMLYVAMPVRHAGKAEVMRVALPLNEVQRRVRDIQKDLALAGMAALVVALVVAVMSVRRISRPVTALIGMAENIGRGQFSQMPAVTSRDEFGRLARTFAEMAERIEEKVSELSQERTQLSGILSALVEGVIALDHQARVLLLNPAAERFFAIRTSDVKGRPFLEVMRQSPLHEVFESALAHEKAATKEITVHTPEERVLSVTAVPVSYGEGRTGVLAAMHDITELRKLERVRQEFVANASHELKTPLTSIKGFVETLLDGAIDDRAHNREFLGTILEQTNRMIQLIEDLLNLSAIEARRVTYRFEPVAVPEIVQRLFQAMTPMAQAKTVTLATDFPPGLPSVRADRDRLGQILLNLVDNAIKFNKPGGRVTVSATQQKGSITIAVADTGTGIPPQDLPRIFERFFRTDRSHSRTIAGTGLGLAIVKHLVDAHQGTVTATSTPAGSTFRVTLPAA